MTSLTANIYRDEDAARAHFEAIRWPHGPVCPHCGVVGNATEMKGATTRKGLYKCREKECRKPFTAIMGTVYEKSHIPLHKWLLATHLMVSSKKGYSALQLQRNLELGSYRTAWFVLHRIREAMRTEDLEPFGQGGGIVESDETFIGVDPDEPKSKAGGNHKMKVLTLVDRTTGQARSRVLDFISAKAIGEIVVANLSREAILMTDEARHYVKLGQTFAGHGHTNHVKGEYVSRFNPLVHTNTVEGFFSVFKRGMRGIYQHCGKQHLHRYLAEFDFRYSNRVALGVDDTERATRAIRGTVGKRLMYQRRLDQAPA